MTLNVDLAITDGILVEGDEVPYRGTIGIKAGKIVAIVEDPDLLEASEIIDAQGRHVLAGAIDGHTHFGHGDGKPDFSSPTEDYRTETAAAAFGGITSIFSFFRRLEEYPPLLDIHIPALEERATIDMGFHLVLMLDEHLKGLDSYPERYGINSFKMFMAYKGEEGRRQGGMQGVDDGLLYEAAQALSRIDGSVLAIHCENVEIIDRCKAKLMAEGREDLRAWSESRPVVAEAEAIRRAAYLVAGSGTKLYVPHLSCEAGLEEAIRAKQQFGSDRVIIETCPHYLTHTQDSDAGPLAKVNTPLRQASDREALWSAIRDGIVDTVGSDHLALDRKRKASIWTGIPGMPGTGTLLPVLLSEGVNKRGIPIERVAAVASKHPAQVWGIYPQKGSLHIGTDADLTIVDLNQEFTFHADQVPSAADFSLYEGLTFQGWPVMTIVRGEVVMREGQIVSTGHGKYLGPADRWVSSA